MPRRLVCLAVALALVSSVPLAKFAFIGMHSSMLNILFGPLWSFDEYCGLKRDNKSIAWNEDNQLSTFFNGSKMLEMANSDRPLIDDLEELIRVSSLADRSINVLCSPISWGYADNNSINNSDSPDANRLDCNLMLDEMLDAHRSIGREIRSRLKVAQCPASAETVNLSQLKSQELTSFDGNSTKTTTTTTNMRTTTKSNNKSRALKNWLATNNFGHTPPSLPFQSNMWPGGYKECLSTGETRFCFGSLQLAKWRRPDHHGDDIIAHPWPALRIGLCLPKVCPSSSSWHGESLKKIDELIKTQLGAISSLGDTGNYQLADVFCLPTEDSRLRAMPHDLLSRLLLLAAISWLVLLASSACLKLIGQEWRLLRSLEPVLDLDRSWNSFLATPEANVNRSSRRPFAGLNAIKVIAMIWLMTTHVMLLSRGYLRSIAEQRAEWRSSLFGAAVLNGQHVVSVFFLISGFLAGSKWLLVAKSPNIGARCKHGKRTTLDSAACDAGDRRKETVFMIVSRYTRLAPMYLLVYVYVKKFAHLMGSGPFWDYGVSEASEARQCMLESWLVPLLMLANFIPPFSHCIITGWHIANDFQIFLALQLLFYVYAKSRRIALFVAMTTFATSHLYHVWNFHWSTDYSHHRLAHEPFVFGPVYIAARMAYDYVNPFGRIGTYFLGFILADLIEDETRQTDRESSQLYREDNDDGEDTTTTTTTNDSDNSNNNNNNDQSKSTLTALSDGKPAPSTGWRPSAAVRVCDWPVANGKANHLSTDRLRVSAQARRTRLFDLAERRGFCALFFSMVLAYCSIAPAVGPVWMKSLFDPVGLSHSLGYPTLRLLAELAWFALLYALLTGTGGLSPSGLSTNTSKECPRVYPQLDATFSKPTLGSRGFLGWPIWDRAVKLNYCLMLTHFSVARYVIQTQTQLLEFSIINFLQLSTFVVMASYLVSLILHLTVEIPLNRLIGRVVVRVLKTDQRQLRS